MICLECLARDCTLLNARQGRRLTCRELKILQLLLDRRSFRQKELAFLLEISPGTLTQHLCNIYSKLGFFGPGSYTALVLWAHEHRKLLSMPRSRMR